MVLGLLCRNLYCCSPFVKETAYKSLDRLKLEYCSSIWDPYHQEHKNKLESVQCRAARFVCKDLRRQSHVSDMLRDLNWKTLEDRRTISRLTLLNKKDHPNRLPSLLHWIFTDQMLFLGVNQNYVIQCAVMNSSLGTTPSFVKIAM